MIKILKNKTNAPIVTQKEDSDAAAQKVLSRMRHKSEEEQASAFAAEIGFSYIDTNLFPVSTESIRILAEEEAKKFNMAVIQKTGKNITLVSTDPTNADSHEFLESLKSGKGWNIKVFVVSRFNLERIFEKYKQIIFVDILDQMSLHLSGEELQKFEDEMKDLITLKQRINELPTTQVLNIMMAGAYKLGASDVHIEPQENQIRLRYRIDGVLQDVAFLPLNVFKSILSRIKLMSGMKINIRDIAQDGTFEIKLPGDKGEKKVETRVSVIPGNFGESIVIRLLDPDSIKVDVDSLGLRGLAYEELQKQTSAPNGMILTTGPTGSGKTTTLYSIINKLNTPDKKIITIEDPIEYVHLHKKSIVNQREVSSDTTSFPSALKYVLRQDPDIILIGEMRDLETISAALTIAETGHLVFATLHTTDAASTVNRIIDVFPPHQQPQIRSQLSFVLQAIFAQQLLLHSSGSGRVLSSEVMIVTPAIRNLIREMKIEQIYLSMQTGGKFGMQTMNQSLFDLYTKRKITYQTALNASTDLEDLKRILSKATV